MCTKLSVHSCFMQHVSNPPGKGILAHGKMRQELSVSIPEHFSCSDVFFNNLHNTNVFASTDVM